MKNKLIIFMTVILSLSVFNISCSDDDDDFIGQDNYINELSLEKDGILYKTQIKQDSILLTIPLNVDLNGATIKTFKMSENATISPEPSSITKWSDKITFEVNSYNKEIRTYFLKIKKIGVIENTNISLHTQNDVNEFAKKGITILAGSLAIGDNNVASDDSITDLSSLSQLVTINGDLKINKNTKINNIIGFENLKSVGNINIESNSTNTADSLDISFDNLIQCGELVINSSKVKSINFPVLKSVLKLYIYAQNIQSIKIPELSNVFRNMTITSKKGSNTQLKEIYLDKLTNISGSLVINNLNKIDTINMPLLNSIGDALLINNVTNIKNISFPLLQSVKGAVSFSKNLDITELELPELTEVGNFLWDGSYSNFKLKDLNLNKLIRVNEDLKINHSLINDINLPSIQYINGKLDIENSPIQKIAICDGCECKSIYLYGGSDVTITELDFSTVKSLESFEVVSYYGLTKLALPKTIKKLTLNGGSDATSFPEILELEEITEEFDITNYKLPSSVIVTSIKKIGSYYLRSFDNLIDFTFTDLEEIGDLSISSYKFTTFSAPKLKKVKNLEFSNIWKLKNINIPLLTEVSEKFSILCGSWNAYRMLIENLDAFKAITSIGSLDIEYCPKLIDFSGIKNAVKDMTADDWKVTNCGYNPTLEDIKAGKYTEE
ncbi:MAG: hypothetical protein WCR47_07445 [Desulfoplanes sp.]